MKLNKAANKNIMKAGLACAIILLFVSNSLALAVQTESDVIDINQLQGDGVKQIVINPIDLQPGQVITPFGTIMNKSQVREIDGVVISVEPTALSMAKGESKVITVSLLAKNLTENTPLTLGIQKFPAEQLPKGVTVEFNPATITLKPDQKTSSNLTISINQTAEEEKYKLRVIVSSDAPFGTVGRDIIDLTVEG